MTLVQIISCCILAVVILAPNYEAQQQFPVYNDYDVDPADLENPRSWYPGQDLNRDKRQNGGFLFPAEQNAPERPWDSAQRQFSNRRPLGPSQFTGQGGNFGFNQGQGGFPGQFGNNWQGGNGGIPGVNQGQNGNFGQGGNGGIPGVNQGQNGNNWQGGNGGIPGVNQGQNGNFAQGGNGGIPGVNQGQNGNNWQGGNGGIPGVNQGQNGNFAQGGNGGIPGVNQGQNGNNWQGGNGGIPGVNQGQNGNFGQGGNGGIPGVNQGQGQGNNPGIPGVNQQGTTTTTVRPARECSCTSTAEYNPVCGTNNRTYSNPGRLRCATECQRRSGGVTQTQLIGLQHYGVCRTTPETRG